MVGRPQTMSSAKHAVLCVDDEPQLLEAIALTLGHRYYVEPAASGHAALEKLRTLTKLSVIISDMRMPQMDGAQFLSAARAIAPDARRILLTGHADIKSAIAAVNDGRVFRYLTKPCSSTELIEAVDAAIADYEAEMIDHSAIRRNVEHALVRSDRLTGLDSREGLLEQLCLLQGQAGTEDQPGAALCLIDVVPPDELLNGYATDTAERIIRVLAERLRSQFKAAECLARPGPHTLAAVLSTPVGTPAALKNLGIRVLEAINQPVETDGAVVKVDMNVGVAPIVAGVEDPRMLVQHAELAVREASQTAGYRVGVFSAESNARAEYRRGLSRALRHSVAREELTLLYQPIVDLTGNCLHSVEALARWEHPQLGFVSPATFIPLIEQMALMVPFGEWALGQACFEVRKVLGTRCPRVSVNVSVTQILDANFMHSIDVALERSGLAASALELEVTESVFAEDIDTVCNLLAEVRGLGIRVALDDFGAGYSSLHYLSRLPVDVVKIDGIFARDFDKGGEAIIGAALSIAEKLGIEAIVEGIETELMLQQVRKLGATKVQGYLYAKPMPGIALRAWLREFTARGMPERLKQVFSSRT